jgi:hypothetical protein
MASVVQDTTWRLRSRRDLYLAPDHGISILLDLRRDRAWRKLMPAAGTRLVDPGRPPGTAPPSWRGFLGAQTDSGARAVTGSG